MKAAHLKTLLTILIFVCILHSSYGQEIPEVQNYCTEYGRFDMLFYNDQISGSYQLLEKSSLGSIWGTLEDSVMTGRWMDGEGTGDIVITFNEGFLWFEVKYNNDQDPDNWIEDEWHGGPRPEKLVVFYRDGIKYVCE
jgi:hypothetical protein